MNMKLQNNHFTFFIDVLAQNRVLEVLSEYKARALRVFVKGGGCSGFSYAFDIVNDISDDDFILESGDNKIAIVIDNMSAMYLNNATLKFEDEMWERRFMIDNPNAKHTCGCGSSFSLKST